MVCLPRFPCGREAEGHRCTVFAALSSRRSRPNDRVVASDSLEAAARGFAASQPSVASVTGYRPSIMREPSLAAAAAADA